ncbi:MAG: type II toxin-antitoxin system HicA family toxin [Deltaproteobacteria bacterium]|nr:type II toxin-antitoxin system HicA family toxin [Deltaproteobacteria bacterium]MBW1796228.1 type II toxin-antitoxin system HicA family toxin [Deltaproteobacteria bacterium]MBW2330390.1 type II toxin-antitoxin system HicA family toxin [Deltaproteobacteria bacterium]
MPACSRGELIRKLRKLGFAGPFPGGKHSYMKRGTYRQIIPNPHGKEISSELVKAIMRQANISADDWLAA